MILENVNVDLWFCGCGFFMVQGVIRVAQDGAERGENWVEISENGIKFVFGGVVAFVP